MRRLRMVAPMLAVLAGVGFYSVNAQPPEGKGPPPNGDRKGSPGAEDRKGPPGAEKGDRKGPPGEGRRGGDRRTDPAVEAWVKTLAEKITDPHDEIRDSARAGLVAVGRPALAILRPLMDGEDGAKATAARKVVAAIEATQPVPAVVSARPEGAGRPGGAGTPGAGNGERRPPGAGPGGPGGPRLDDLFDDLGLNDKQRKQVDEIMQSHREKMRELNEQVESGKVDREKARDSRKELHEAMKKEMKEILNAEQYAKFEEGMSKLPRPGNGDRPPGDRPPQP